MSTESTRAATSLEELRQIAEKATPGDWYLTTAAHSGGTARQFIRSREVVPNQSTDHAVAEAWGGNGPNEDDGAFIATFNPRLALCLLDAVSVLKSIHGRAGMTQLADCCVDKTCTPHYVDGEKEGGCTWQSGVARGFGECASLAEEALATLEAAGVKV